ncbi:MAG: hypothetical protein AB8E82_19840 [Aureispira sp.]
MRNLFLLIILIAGILGTTQAQTNKTLVKSVALTAAQEVVVELPGVIERSTWDNNFIRVTTYLTVENMNENIVKQLVLVGRYNLSADLQEGTGTLVISMPKINNEVRVKGTALVERLRFEIQAPAGYPLVVKEIVLEETANAGETPAL